MSNETYQPAMYGFDLIYPDRYELEAGPENGQYTARLQIQLEEA